MGVRVGGTTPDGMFTLASAECQAACTEAPCLQVNYRYRYRVDAAQFDQLIDDLASGALEDEIPSHGITARIPQCIPAERAVGAVPPDEVHEAPVWLAPSGSKRSVRRGTGLMASYTIPHAPGFVANDAPRIVTERFDHPTALRSYTFERYLATGGYEGLRAALERAPADVHSEVRDATLLGRGGAGFPAGVKWGFCPPGVWPRYLVVNGDESEPGTYKDRLLMELDPHQIVEGCLIACYAVGLSQCFLYIRGEMALAQERVAQALNEAYDAGWVGRNICGTDFSVDIVLHSGAGAYVVGEETALHREPRRQAGHAAG